MPDRDRIAGSAKQVKGAAKKAVGKAIGDAKMVAEGSADQAEGRIQNAVGGVKDKMRDTFRDKKGPGSWGASAKLLTWTPEGLLQLQRDPSPAGAQGIRLSFLLSSLQTHREIRFFHLDFRVIMFLGEERVTRGMVLISEPSRRR